MLNFWGGNIDFGDTMNTKEEREKKPNFTLLSSSSSPPPPILIPSSATTMNTIDRFNDFTLTIYKTDSRFRERKNSLKILISYFLESVETMSLRDTSMGEQSEILKRIDFLIEMYIPRLDIMLAWLHSKIQQLPVSSENFPSNLRPEEIEFLHKYVTGLEKEQSLLQRSQIHCSYSMDDVIRWEKRLVGNMNMPNLMAAFQSPGDQRSLLQIPQQKAGTPLQSTNLSSSTLSSCTPLASSDLPASVDATSSRGTSVDEQTEITNKYNFMKEAYIPLLDEMLARWGCRIQQLPISSENLPSHLQPDEIEYIRKYKTNLEKARYMFQISQGPRGSMDDVIRWEKKFVGYLNLSNVMAAVQLPGDLLSQLQIPRVKQHDSNQNNPVKSVSTLTPIERLVKAVERSSPKALSATVKDIRSVVSMTDVFAGAHPGEGGARSFFHENLASTTKGHVERRNFQVIKSVDEKKLCYSVERWVLDYNEDNGVTGFESSAATSGIKKSRLEVNHVLVEEVGAINRVLINTKLSISDESITLPSGAGEDVGGMIVNCTFSPMSSSSSTEKSRLHIRISINRCKE
ncbi:hypothetical protein MKW98_009091 [Papaver atlanticum]|uniref:Uncharacterized protein n=1 Tax=Papaver atlanticum TaxID=357466 RepID=A0AAD4T5G5_9MAGN|nr:hypothetical protein MKW98_009091 [Papaver atlanticum]